MVDSLKSNLPDMPDLPNLPNLGVPPPPSLIPNGSRDSGEPVEPLPNLIESNNEMNAIRHAANPSFRFVVNIDGINNAVFTECTPPALEWEVQEIKEGGMNEYAHRLPVRQKGARMTLKNGLGTNALLRWCIKSITMSPEFERKNVTVTLYNVSHKPFIKWTIEGAYPLKWTSPTLKSDDNAIAIQTLDLAGNKVTVAEFSNGS